MGLVPDSLAPVREALETAQRTWGDRGEVVLEPGPAYADGDPVRIRVRKRGRRYDLHDDGGAIARAGRPGGWREPIERLVDADGLNVNRRGVVFVRVVEGRDVAALARRLAETSRSVYLALLELEGGQRR
jgi:hypothetical protein